MARSLLYPATVSTPHLSDSPREKLKCPQVTVTGCQWQIHVHLEATPWCGKSPGHEAAGVRAAVQVWRGPGLGCYLTGCRGQSPRQIHEHLEATPWRVARAGMLSDRALALFATSGYCSLSCLGGSVLGRGREVGLGRRTRSNSPSAGTQTLGGRAETVGGGRHPEWALSQVLGKKKLPAGWGGRSPHLGTLPPLRKFVPQE